MRRSALHALTGSSHTDRGRTVVSCSQKRSFHRGYSLESRNSNIDQRCVETTLANVHEGVIRVILVKLYSPLLLDSVVGGPSVPSPAAQRQVVTVDNLLCREVPETVFSRKFCVRLDGIACRERPATSTGYQDAHKYTKIETQKKIKNSSKHEECNFEQTTHHCPWFLTLVNTPLVRHYETTNFFRKNALHALRKLRHEKKFGTSIAVRGDVPLNPLT